MSSVLQDLRHALRLLRRSPGFTAVVVLSLAVGIGANAAVFSIVDAVLLRPLPVERPEELVAMGWLTEPGVEAPDIGISGWYLSNDDGTYRSTSFPVRAFEELRGLEEARALENLRGTGELRGSEGPFSSVFAFAPLYRVSLQEGDTAEVTEGQYVSGDYHRTLGIRPSVGRLLGPDDDRSDAEPVAVLDHGFWQRRFGGDPGIVGEVLRLNGVPFTVVGVTPEGFQGTGQVGTAPELTVPLSAWRHLDPGNERMAAVDFWWLRIMARRRPGVSLEEAGARADAVFQGAMSAALGPEVRLPRLTVAPGDRGLSEERERTVGPLRILAAVVALVLLISCVNVANLSLARVRSRRPALALRQFLGASRGRVFRQLLTESLVLGVLSGVAGLAVAVAARGVLLQATIGPDFVAGLPLDLRLLGFTAGASALAGLLFGLVPALYAARVPGSAVAASLTSGMRSTGLSGTGLPGTGHSGIGLSLNKGLMAVQVGMSIVLLAGAGLFIRSLERLESTAGAFNSESTLVFRLNPGLSGIEGAEAVALFDRVLEGLRTLPGAESVAAGWHPPVGGRISYYTLVVPGYEAAEDESVGAFVNAVSEGFFETLEIPLVAGRTFGPEDGPDAPDRVVLNRALAERYFGDADPLGRTIGLGQGSTGTEYEVIGVVENVKYQQQRDEMYPTAHVLYRQDPDTVTGFQAALSFMIRSRGEPLTLVPAARQVAAAVDAGVPLHEVTTLERLERAQVGQEVAFALLSSVLGAVALGLVCIGLYGLLSYAVLGRTREIGVRMALGADRGDVARLVGRELLPVGAGVILGLGGAWASTRVIESLLYEVAPTDPLALAGAVAVLLSVALAAAAVPARRAAAIDPAEALRFD